MKALLISLILFVQLSMTAQQELVVCTDGNPTETIVQVDGQTYTFNEAHQPHLFWLTLADGLHTLTVTDTGGDGFGNGGMVLITYGTDQLSFMIVQEDSDFWDENNQITMNFTVQSPAPVTDTCPADLNHNGIVGVSDLLIFIAAYGDICE